MYGQHHPSAQPSNFHSNYGHPGHTATGYGDPLLSETSSMPNMDGLGISMGTLHTQGMPQLLFQMENRIDGRLLEHRDRIEKLER